MSYLCFYTNNSSYKFSGSEYSFENQAQRSLRMVTGTSYINYPLTTDVTASAYCPLGIKSGTKTYRIARMQSGEYYAVDSLPNPPTVINYQTETVERLDAYGKVLDGYDRINWTATSTDLDDINYYYSLGKTETNTLVGYLYFQNQRDVQFYQYSSASYASNEEINNEYLKSSIAIQDESATVYYTTTFSEYSLREEEVPTDVNDWKTWTFETFNYQNTGIYQGREKIKGSVPQETKFIVNEFQYSTNSTILQRADYTQRKSIAYTQTYNKEGHGTIIQDLIPEHAYSRWNSYYFRTYLVFLGAGTVGGQPTNGPGVLRKAIPGNTMTSDCVYGPWYMSNTSEEDDGTVIFLNDPDMPRFFQLDKNSCPPPNNMTGHWYSFSCSYALSWIRNKSNYGSNSNMYEGFQPEHNYWDGRTVSATWSLKSEGWKTQTKFFKLDYDAVNNTYRYKVSNFTAEENQSHFETWRSYRTRIRTITKNPALTEWSYLDLYSSMDDQKGMVFNFTNPQKKKTDPNTGETYMKAYLDNVLVSTSMKSVRYFDIHYTGNIPKWTASYRSTWKVSYHKGNYSDHFVLNGSAVPQSVRDMANQVDYEVIFVQDFSYTTHWWYSYPDVSTEEFQDVYEEYEDCTIWKNSYTSDRPRYIQGPVYVTDTLFTYTMRKSDGNTYTATNSNPNDGYASIETYPIKTGVSHHHDFLSTRVSWYESVQEYYNGESPNLGNGDGYVVNQNVYSTATVPEGQTYYSTVDTITILSDKFTNTYSGTSWNAQQIQEATTTWDLTATYSYDLEDQAGSPSYQIVSERALSRFWQTCSDGVVKSSSIEPGNWGEYNLNEPIVNDGFRFNGGNAGQIGNLWNFYNAYGNAVIDDGANYLGAYYYTRQVYTWKNITEMIAGNYRTALSFTAKNGGNQLGNISLITSSNDYDDEIPYAKNPVHLDYNGTLNTTSIRLYQKVVYQEADPTSAYFTTSYAYRDYTRRHSNNGIQYQKVTSSKYTSSNSTLMDTSQVNSGWEDYNNNSGETKTYSGSENTYHGSIYKDQYSTTQYAGTVTQWVTYYANGNTYNNVNHSNQVNRLVSNAVHSNNLTNAGVSKSACVATGSRQINYSWLSTKGAVGNVADSGLIGDKFSRTTGKTTNSSVTYSSRSFRQYGLEANKYSKWRLFTEYSGTKSVGTWYSSSKSYVTYTGQKTTQYHTFKVQGYSESYYYKTTAWAGVSEENVAYEAKGLQRKTGFLYKSFTMTSIFNLDKYSMGAYIKKDTLNEYTIYSANYEENTTAGYVRTNRATISTTRQSDVYEDYDEDLYSTRSYYTITSSSHNAYE